MAKIDLNRGVEIRKTAQGADVYMYVDNPGVYLNAYELEVDTDLAKQAGFPVEQHAKVRARRLRQVEVIAALDQEFEGSVEAEIGEIVETLGGFEMIRVGPDRYSIKDPDGEPMVQRPLSQAEAKFTWDKLVVPGVSKGGGAKGSDE